MYAPPHPRRYRMRRIVLTAVAAFVSGGILAGAALSQAQPAPPPGQPITQQTANDPSHRPGMTMGWRRHDRASRVRNFALIYRQPDRQLAPADVQKIAEGFLLWNGNHTWKVTNVAPMADGPIGFDLSTPEGSVIAKFTMDPHTGKIARIG